MGINRFMMSIPPKFRGSLSQEQYLAFNLDAGLVASLLMHSMKGLDELESDGRHTLLVDVWPPDESATLRKRSTFVSTPGSLQVRVQRDVYRAIDIEDPEERAELLLEWLVEGLGLIWERESWPPDMLDEAAERLWENDFGVTLSYQRTKKNPSRNREAIVGLDIHLGGMDFWVECHEKSGGGYKVKFAEFPATRDQFAGRNKVFDKYTWIDKDRFRITAGEDFEEWVIDFSDSPPTIEHDIKVDREYYERRRHLNVG
jgi:hypothetical protein